LLNSNISSTCPHDMVNFSLLKAEIGWRAWGTPANFNGFHTLASLLHQRCSTDVNQTLHAVWPSPGLIHNIYIFGGSCLQRNFARCKIHFASKSCVLLYWQHCCMQSSSGRQPNFAAFSRGHHQYSEEQLSRWASAHVLVNY